MLWRSSYRNKRMVLSTLASLLRKRDAVLCAIWPPPPLSLFLPLALLFFPPSPPLSLTLLPVLKLSENPQI